MSPTERTAERTLVVLRHAKAEAFADDDSARSLTDRGRREAADAGRWLAGQGIVPDAALVSSAARTRETWDLVAESAGWQLEPTFDDALYTAGPESALEVLRAADPDARVLVFVGHNPTAAYLANTLCDATPDPDAFRAMSSGFPPAALAVLTLPAPWSDLTDGSATLTAFHAPS